MRQGRVSGCATAPGTPNHFEELTPMVEKSSLYLRAPEQNIQQQHRYDRKKDHTTRQSPTRCTHVSLYVCADVDGERVGPGHGHVLLPPAVHHDSHVEAQHKRHRDEGAEVGAVARHLLEQAVGTGRDRVQTVSVYHVSLPYNLFTPPLRK